MKPINASLVCTVLNEEEYIEKFIDSIFNQNIKPTEIIIVDGGSIDNTVALINKKIKQFKNKLNIKVLIKKGNRSVGRNFGISKARSSIILITDSGCLLDKNWVKNIVKPFANKSTDVVAGYYKGKPRNIFQKSLIPFVLVMEDKLKPEEFLPATRSMAIKKSVWKKIGKFDEKFSHNEDFVFANKLKDKGFNIKFEKDAIVYWIPRSSIKQVFKMFYRFAYGDVEAGILRVNVLFLFLRYIIGIYLLILIPIMKSMYLNLFVLMSIVTYISWSILKNYKYVNNYKAIIYLPSIQIIADFSVIWGSLIALFKNYSINIINYFRTNKLLTCLLFVYVLTMLSMIDWGIPNVNHPFNYFMDEWHQSQAVRNLFTKGSPNIEGSANGSIFQFFLSGLYLIPFILIKVVDVFAIKSSVLNLGEQQKLFEILRLNTIIFGVLSISTFYYICKKYFKFPILATILFTFNPVWIMLSNYFKYDIALMFWLLLSILFLIRYAVKPNLIDFLFAGIFSSIALSTKLSVEPLLIGYVLTFFIFTKNIRQNIKWLLVGLFIYTLIFIIFGIPDVILGKGNLFEYLNSNLIRNPAQSSAVIKLPSGIWNYLLLSLYPSIFGYVMYFGFIISIPILLCIKIIEYPSNKKNIKENFLKKSPLVIIWILFTLFVLSLIPLKLGASSNRVLILLPFFSIVIAFTIFKIKSKIKNMFIFNFLLIIVFSSLIIQIFQTYLWVEIKQKEDLRQITSDWILKNIPTNSVIGIENIPIYQTLPDIIVKEFYLQQYKVNEHTKYKYVILNNEIKRYPKFVIITNANIEMLYLYYSPKINNIKKIEYLNYKRIKTFSLEKTSNLNLFTNKFNFYMAATIQSPLEISIYEKK